jgi:hypothetical protein
LQPLLLLLQQLLLIFSLLLLLLLLALLLRPQAVVLVPEQVAVPHSSQQVAAIVGHSRGTCWAVHSKSSLHRQLLPAACIIHVAAAMGVAYVQRVQQQSFTAIGLVCCTTFSSMVQQ